MWLNVDCSPHCAMQFDNRFIVVHTKLDQEFSITHDVWIGDTYRRNALNDVHGKNVSSGPLLSITCLYRRNIMAPLYKTHNTFKSLNYTSKYPVHLTLGKWLNRSVAYHMSKQKQDAKPEFYNRENMQDIHTAGTSYHPETNDLERRA